MKCGFCGREVEKGVLECPYCHYRFEVDAQVLTPDERDTFEGVTIEQDGSTVDNKNMTNGQGAGYEQGARGWPTNSTGAPASLYTSYSKGNMQATLSTILATFLARPLFQAQAEGAM